MRGTLVDVNRALLRPILLAGVEKRLMMANILLCFPLVAMTHFNIIVCLFTSILFGILHLLCQAINRDDPHVSNLLKRFSRYCWQGYYPPLSHVHHQPFYVVKTIS